MKTTNSKRGKQVRTSPPARDKAVKPASAETDNPQGAMLGVGGLAEIRQLIRLVQRTGIGELEVSSGQRTVRIAAQAHLAVGLGPALPVALPAPAPDADPFVEVGDLVEVGQTVCIIEAMKLMNEIESDFRGRVVKILVENAQPVEFGQKLFLIEPA